MVRSRYPGLSGAKLIQVLQKQYNLTVISQRGSHIKVEYNHRRTIIPNHKNLAYGTFSGILAQLSIDEEEFLNKI